MSAEEGKWVGWYAYELQPPPIKKPDGTVYTTNMVLAPGMPAIADTLLGPVLGELKRFETSDGWYVETEGLICPVVVHGVEYCCNTSFNKACLEKITEQP